MSLRGVALQGFSHRSIDSLSLHRPFPLSSMIHPLLPRNDPLRIEKGIQKSPRKSKAVNY
jgi:hypothetical protein